MKAISAEGKGILGHVEFFLLWIVKVQIAIALLALTGMVVLNVWEIFIRYFFQRSIRWIQDITLLLSTWMVFTGFSAVVYYKKDITVSFLVELLPPRLQIIISIIGKIIIIAFLTIFIQYGYKLYLRQVGDVTMVGRFPLNLYTLPLAIGGGTALLIYVIDLLKQLASMIKGAQSFSPDKEADLT